MGKPINDPVGGVGENFTVQFQPGQETIFPLAKFSVASDADGFIPFQIDYTDPTFLKLNYTGKWDASWVVIPENYTSNDWVSLEFREIPLMHDWFFSSRPLPTIDMLDSPSADRFAGMVSPQGLQWSDRWRPSGKSFFHIFFFYGQSRIFELTLSS